MELGVCSLYVLEKLPASRFVSEVLSPNILSYGDNSYSFRCNVFAQTLLLKCMMVVCVNGNRLPGMNLRATDSTRD